MIEADIDKYQDHIDNWIKKINGMAGNVQKIRGTLEPFKIKSNNVSKLKDYLQKEIKRNK